MNVAPVMSTVPPTLHIAPPLDPAVQPDMVDEVRVRVPVLVIYIPPPWVVAVQPDMVDEARVRVPVERIAPPMPVVEQSEIAESDMLRVLPT